MSITKELDSRYIVSSTGEVFDKSLNRYLKKSKQSLGYTQICIHGRLKYLHRVVAQVFIPNPEGKKEVDHIDYNRSNNNVDNLRWVTRSENLKHSACNRNYEIQLQSAARMREAKKKKFEKSII